MAWNPLDQPVDYVVIQGKRTPGIATIEAVESKRKWDERKSSAAGGANLVFKGVDTARFKMRIRLLTAAHWDEWETFRPTVQRIPGTDAAALDIEHPFLDVLGIASVVVEYLKQPEQTGDGEWTIEVGLLEYRKFKRAAAPVRGSNTTTPDQQRDPRDLVIEALRTQNDALAGIS